MTTLGQTEQISMVPIEKYNPQDANHNRVILRQTTNQGGYRIEVIGRHQITWWRRFLSIFDVGLLAHTTIHLKEVAHKLAQSGPSWNDNREPEGRSVISAAC